MKEGWQTRPLRELLEVQNGYAFDAKRFNPSEGVPLIRIRDLKAGVGTETRFTGDYDEKYLVKAGDLLIGMDGEFGCYEWKGDKALLNQRVCRLQGFGADIIPRFLLYGVNGYLKEIEDVTGFTTVKHLSSKQILSIEFPVPPLPEQERIVGILDEAFDGIAKAKATAEANLQNARALFQSHLQTVFSQKGEGWVDSTLEDVLAVLRNGMNCKQDKKGVGSKISRIESIWNAEFDISRVGYAEISAAQREKFGLKKGDVLFSHINSAIHVGKTALFDLDEEVIHGVNLLLMRPKPFVSPSYLDLYLKHIFAAGYWLRVCKQSINQASVNQKDINRVPFRYPSQQRQKEIVEELQNLQSETQRLESLYQNKLNALDELKKSLLHQAFTGNL